MGLTDAYVSRVRTDSGVIYAGALVGVSFGTVTASHATGGAVSATDAATTSGSRVGGFGRGNRQPERDQRQLRQCRRVHQQR